MKYIKKGTHNGAMLLRLAGVEIEKKKELVLSAFSKHSKELINAYAILSKR